MMGMTSSDIKPVHRAAAAAAAAAATATGPTAVANCCRSPSVVVIAH